MRYIQKHNMTSLLLVAVLSIPLVLYLSCDEPPPGYTGPWQEVETPGGEGHLSDCYFNSPTDGWACGSEGDSPDIVLIHWNGTEWEEYEYPGWFEDEDYIDITLLDISFSSPDCGWCVGSLIYENTGEDNSSGFILKYDGFEWYVFEEHLGESVSSVFAISDDDVWFSSWEPDYGSSGADLFHWNGSELEFVNLYPGNYGISDLAFSSSDEGLAVGRNRYIYHWDGNDWELVYYSVGGEARGVSYDTPNTAYIVEENRLSRWEDGEYRVLSDDEWGGSYSEVHFSSPDEGWIIGSEWINGDLYSYTWHWDGSSWTAIEKPDGMSSYDIFSIDSDNVWIVGMKSGPYCCSWRYVDK